MKTKPKEQINEKENRKVSILPHASKLEKVNPKVWSEAVTELKSRVFENEQQMFHGVIETVCKKMNLSEDPEMKEALTMMLESDDIVREILKRDLRIGG